MILPLSPPDFSGARFRFRILPVLLFVLGGCAAPAVEPEVEVPVDRPNVLLICVDDLRPEVGGLGADDAITPNLDALADAGVAFARHYAQVPSCGASRASMLTGRYPRHLHGLSDTVFESLQFTGRPSLPGWFRLNGYQTISLGKVSESADGRRLSLTDRRRVPELIGAWDEVGAPSGRWRDAATARWGYADGEPGGEDRPALEEGDGRPTPDGLVVDAAVQRLRNMNVDRPFFLAVGLHRPSLPYTAPRAWFDRHRDTDIRPPAYPRAPEGVEPDVSLHDSPELLKQFGGHPEAGLQDPAYVQRLRQAYYACVSHTDEQIGRLLVALDETGLDHNTLVIVWGDHGTHLGEHGLWGSGTLQEWALRSTLIMRGPGIGKGTCSNCVESVDLYPTLIDLCHLPAVAGLDGQSLRPMLEYPIREVRRGARSFWRQGVHVGRSIRTPRWRLTEWRRGGETVQIELYDHTLDPEETQNRARTRLAKVVELTRELGAPRF